MKKNVKRRRRKKNQKEKKSLFSFFFFPFSLYPPSMPAVAALATAAVASRRTVLAVTTRRRGARPRSSSSSSSLVVPKAHGGGMWTFAGGGRDQGSLVDYLVAQRRGGGSGKAFCPAAVEAMRAVDRREFIGPVEESRANIYLVREGGPEWAEEEGLRVFLERATRMTTTGIVSSSHVLVLAGAPGT